MPAQVTQRRVTMHTINKAECVCCTASESPWPTHTNGHARHARRDGRVVRCRAIWWCCVRRTGSGVVVVLMPATSECAMGRFWGGKWGWVT